MARPKLRQASSASTTSEDGSEDREESSSTPSRPPLDSPAIGPSENADLEGDKPTHSAASNHPCRCPAPELWPIEYPMPPSVRTAVARLLEARTHAALQENIVAEAITKEWDKLRGVGNGFTEPQQQSLFIHRDTGAQGHSRYVGVQRAKQNKWKATIRRRGVVTNLSMFDTEIEAVEAYQIASAEYERLHLRLYKAKSGRLRTRAQPTTQGRHYSTSQDE